MTSASKRLSKQDCVDLRAQLADLGYGQAEAETPELFAHRLYPVSVHLRALDRNVVLVVGPRGSGKSALFHAFFGENRGVATAIAEWMPRAPILENHLGYDELDTLGGFDWVLMARMVRGLVAFWSDYSRRWRRIRAKIFLRSDLFRRHAGMGTADFAKLAANRAELVWSDAALLAMLVKRIANTSKGLSGYCRSARIRFHEHAVLGLIPEIKEARNAFPLLERLSGEFMGAGKKKGFVRNWVLAHLRDGNDRVSPRTLVRLIEQAAGKGSVNLTLSPPKLIHPTALRLALDDVSDNHVTQGISSEWPWLEGVRERLARSRLVPWVRKEVLDLFDAGWERTWGPPGGRDVRPPVEQPADFVDYLIDLGVFRRRSDERIDVPDLYLSGLNLRRKGGVRRGPRRGPRAVGGA